MNGRRSQGLLLAAELKVSGNYLRSANVELSPVGAISTYLPTARALDVLRRVARGLAVGPQNRAWSITGPYGTGKSSFALFLRALLSDEAELRDVAMATLDEVDPALADGFRSGLAQLQTGESSFVLAVATAAREPIVASLVRALSTGIRERWPQKPPAPISRALSAARHTSDASAITNLVRAVSAHAPLLILIDEFGKNLECFAGERSETDLFVMQSLAELASAGDGAVFLVTLQHLAFDDYVRTATGAERREWGKVQGRFEDISFIETTDDATRLVCRVIDDAEAGPKFRKARRQWAEKSFAAASELGLAAHLSGGVDTVEACYPLHPLVLLTLPELCSKFGQHGRTLFTFLAGGEPAALGDFLGTAIWSSTHLPVVGLQDIYDYFVSNVATLIRASSNGNRWLEVETRIRETPGLSQDELELVKTIGLLNLIGQGGLLRASPRLLAHAMGDESGEATERTLERLCSNGLLTYRDFANEYRLWQGSDFDISEALAGIREEQAHESVAAQLGRMHDSVPVIAGRHSQRVGMLRYFSVQYLDDPGRVIDEDPEDDSADGVLAFFIGDPKAAEGLKSAGGRPVVVATSGSSESLRSVVREAAATQALLARPKLQKDWVALREVQERAAEARRQLSVALRTVFAVGNPEVEWRLFRVGFAQTLPVGSVDRGLSHLLSGICDLVYTRSPVINNEMLGRRDLTSQGAKARRMLLSAMIEMESEKTLGISGYGPERAMYEAFLHYTGLHARRHGGDAWSFGEPHPGNELGSAWERMNELVDSAGELSISVDHIFRQLSRAPYGLKLGPLPVLLTAMLLARADEVAIYQDGSYIPVLTADLIERLVKTPDRFAVKFFEVTADRGRLLALLASQLNIEDREMRSRNSSLLKVIVPILNLIRGLPESVAHAEDLSPTTLALRDVLLSVREPDDLLFTAMPVALGLPAVGSKMTPAARMQYATALHEALTELRDWHGALLARIGDSVAKALQLSTATPDLRLDLRALSRRLGSGVLDPKMKSFLYLASDDGFDDSSWLEALGLSLSGRPPSTWRPADRDRFAAGLTSTAGALHRLEALHLDIRGRSEQGFLAQRHTITRSDGQEDSLLVAVDEALVSATLPKVRQVLAELPTRADRQAFVAAMMAELLRGEVSEPPVSLTAARKAPRTGSQRARKEAAG